MKAGDILRTIADGGVLVATRQFPQQRKYFVRQPDDHSTGREGRKEEITEATVIRLVNKGLVYPKPIDPQWDSISYELTAAGRLEADSQPLTAAEKRAR